MLDVSIIIVNYNTKKLIQNCIKSIFEQTKDISYEVIVSDNGSVDGSIEMIKSDFPQVILLENNANLGFGIANNRGLKIAKGKYIFYLNSDTVLLNNAVKYFFDYWEENGEKQNIGALGCNLIDSEGKNIHSGGSGISKNKELFSSLMLLISISIKTLFLFLTKNNHLLNKLSKPFVQKQYKEQFGFVDVIIGADLFLKNNKFAFFDEDYFMYYEEGDLENKLKKIHKNMLLVKGPKIVHLEGMSEMNKHFILNYSSFSKIQYRFSQITYIRKNTDFNFPYCFMLKIITILIWLNPFLIKKTLKFIPKLVRW